MSYNIIDIIDKVIKINQDRIKIYKEYLEEINISEIYHKTRYLIIIRAILKSIEKENEYYRGLKNKDLNLENQDINILVYDKISFLMEEFKNSMNGCTCCELKDLIPCFIDMEKRMLALLINIQGRLVIETKDTESLAYVILGEMIEERRKVIEKLYRLG